LACSFDVFVAVLTAVGTFAEPAMETAATPTEALGESTLLP
jgi:hypothetical protein